MKQQDYLLFAWYMKDYPHGPLAVLQDIWVGEVEYPSPKTEIAVDLVKDLREKLEVA